MVSEHQGMTMFSHSDNMTPVISRHQLYACSAQAGPCFLMKVVSSPKPSTVWGAGERS